MTGILDHNLGMVKSGLMWSMKTGNLKVKMYAKPIRSLKAMCYLNVGVLQSNGPLHYSPWAKVTN